MGGGVIGCAVARELSRYQGNIVLLEAASDICEGQSKANSAIVHAGYDAKPGTNKAKFNVRGAAMFPKVCEELDVPYQRNTSLVVSFSMDDHQKLEDLRMRGVMNGVEGLTIIGSEKLHELEPNLSPEAVEALLVPGGAICCPYELTWAYAENAAINGVTFYRGTPVTSIQRMQDGSYLVSSHERKFHTRAVVNCAGVHSAELHNMVSADSITMLPRRGQYYLLDKKLSGSFHATIFQLPTSLGKGCLVAPTVDGTILLGPTAEDITDGSDTATTQQGLDTALESCKISWPSLPGRSFITEFSGVRAHCDRDDFVLGEPSDAPGFFDATGIESPGLSSAPAIAEYLAVEVSAKLALPEKQLFENRRRGIPKFRSLDDDTRKKLIATNPDWGKIVCRCEMVTEAEIRLAIRRPVGAVTMDGIKRRTRAGMGRCQSGFCTPRVLEILCEELSLKPTEVTKSTPGSYLIEGSVFQEEA